MRDEAGLGLPDTCLPPATLSGATSMCPSSTLRSTRPPRSALGRLSSSPLFVVSSATPLRLSAPTHRLYPTAVASRFHTEDRNLHIACYDEAHEAFLDMVRSGHRSIENCQGALILTAWGRYVLHLHLQSLLRLRRISVTVHRRRRRIDLSELRFTLGW